VRDGSPLTMSYSDGPGDVLAAGKVENDEKTDFFEKNLKILSGSKI
jgi:hypothetical protein